jgi:aspartyl-tRNA(Asn)/glutamyl-tRNA(Gln) amidotransferase subunit A
VTIHETGKLIRSRQLSCVELVQQTVADIKKRDVFRTLITVTEEQALAEARVLDTELAQGKDRGPLHGIPTAHKDVFYTRGIRTTGGSLVFRDFVPNYSATVVDGLAAGGAISVGKTNLHELAYGATSKNPHYGFVLNPHKTAHVAGGSSGGSAALIAANLLPYSMGTDTAGSIRMPASYCGVVGLKPTYGRVSRYGMLPLAFSLDHAGPLAATVEDCALVMNAISGPDPKDPSCVARPAPDATKISMTNLKGVRVGVPGNFYFRHVHEEVASAVKRKIAEIESLGAFVSEVHVPDMDEANMAARIVQLSEAASLYTAYHDAAQFGDDVWALIEQGRMLRAHEYVNAQRFRTVFRREFDLLWKKIDVLVTPTTPMTAPGIHETTVRFGDHEEDVRIASTRLCRATNFLGEPSLSMPCGKTETGLPIGLQLIGAPFTEPKLLAVARLLEN